MVAVKKKKKMMMMTATRSDVLRSVRRGCSLSQDDLKSGYHRTYIGQLSAARRVPRYARYSIWLRPWECFRQNLSEE